MKIPRAERSTLTTIQTVLVTAICTGLVGDAGPAPPRTVWPDCPQGGWPSGGLVAGICVWQLSPVSHSTTKPPPPEDVPMADDQGGEGAALLVTDYEDPPTEPGPSPSRLGNFGQAAVSVDSIACAGVGREVLLKEGTAVDAAVAVLFCNGVVTSQSMGLGGGFLMTIFLANGTSSSLVAREVTPAAASLDMFKNQSSKLGPLSSGVPGELLGYWEAKLRHGNPALPWASLVEPAIKLCEEGIRVSSDAARSLKYKEEHVRADPGLRSVFFNEAEDRVLRKGEMYRHPVLARTLRRIAEGGADELYRGETGRQMVEDIQGAGGIISLSDLENYSVSWESPVMADLPNTDGLRLTTSPPPGSGAVMAAILGIAGGYNPSPSDRRKPLTWHRFLEAVKFCFAKRTFLGDWNYEPVKEEVQQAVTNLTSSSWQSWVRSKISDAATHQDLEYYGARFYNVEDGGTSHISIISPSGDAVSVTSTINLHYGSKFMSPSTGIILNNQMDDFSFPSLINHFGVPPSENNFAYPGKRPVSSMSPTIVYDRDNRVVAVVGASGGTKIITGVAQVIYQMLYLGKGVKEAVDSPRFHTQLYPDEVKYEVGTTKWLAQGLKQFGHKLVRFPAGGSTVQAILVDRSTGNIMANADFRKNGTVDGI